MNYFQFFIVKSLTFILIYECLKLLSFKLICDGKCLHKEEHYSTWLHVPFTASFVNVIFFLMGDPPPKCPHPPNFIEQNLLKMPVFKVTLDHFSSKDIKKSSCLHAFL